MRATNKEIITVCKHLEPYAMLRYNAIPEIKALNYKRVKKCEYAVCVRGDFLGDPDLSWLSECDDDFDPAIAQLKYPLKVKGEPPWNYEGTLGGVNETGYMVCKISGCGKHEIKVAGVSMHQIMFDEYAFLTEEQGKEFGEANAGAKNPVFYMDAGLVSLDFSSLDFKKVPKIDRDFIAKYEEDRENCWQARGLGTAFPESEKQRQREGLSFDDAKVELATFYGVDVENIEIVIRG